MFSRVFPASLALLSLLMLGAVEIRNDPAGADAVPAVWREYRTVIVVLPFINRAPEEMAGQAAADTMAAALEQGGLAIVRRPSQTSTPDISFELVTTDGVTTTRTSITQGGADAVRRSSESQGIPQGDFIVRGEVALAGETWQVNAALFAAGTGEQLLAASQVVAGEGALFKAAAAVAAQLRPGYEDFVASHRARDLLAQCDQGLLAPPLAMDRMDALRRDHPDCFTPVALLYLLALRSEDEQTILASAESVALWLGKGRPDDLRLLDELDLNPYEPLVARARLAGAEELVEVLRVAATFPKGCVERLRELARALTTLNRVQEAVKAYESLLLIAPRDGRARLELGRLLEIAHPLAARAHYQAFIECEPEAPERREIEARIAALSVN